MTEAAAEPAEPTLPLTVDSPIAWAEFLIDHAALRAYYDRQGIHCFNCCAAEAETFASGAKVHAGGPYGAFEPQKVVDELNALAKEHPFNPATYKRRTLMTRVLDILFPSQSS
jgi:hypothetical protein